VRLIEVMARTAIINCTVAVVIFAIAADLGLVIIRRFEAIAFVVALEIFAHTVRLIEVMARTAFVYDAIAVVVFAITDLGFVIIRRFGAIAFVVTLEIFAHTV
jgi:hypothetical protein